MPETYRGWEIREISAEFSREGARYVGTSPDYDVSYEGPEDGFVRTGEFFEGECIVDVKQKIDEWIEENSDAE